MSKKKNYSISQSVDELTHGMITTKQEVDRMANLRTALQSISSPPSATNSSALSYGGLNPQAELYIPSYHAACLENSAIASSHIDPYFYSRYLSSLDYITTHCDILELISRMLPLTSPAYQDAGNIIDTLPCFSCSCMAGDSASSTDTSRDRPTIPSSANSVLSPQISGFPRFADELDAAELPSTLSLVDSLGPFIPPRDSGIPLFSENMLRGGGDAVQVTNYGTISVSLRHRIQVDITLDKAIRVVNNTGKYMAAINNTGDSCCVVHPYARALLEDGVIHIESGERLAKISDRGIAFTSLSRSLVFLVDASGTKSTAEKFRDLQDDCSINVFFDNSNHGREAIQNCFVVMRQMSHKIFPNGDEIWVIGGVFVKQTAKGDVRVAKNSGQYLLKTSPNAGTVCVITPHLYMLASKDPEEHLTVRVGSKQVKNSENGFSVKNGSQKAGFDRSGEFILI